MLQILNYKKVLYLSSSRNQKILLWFKTFHKIATPTAFVKCWTILSPLYKSDVVKIITYSIGLH